MLLHQIRHRSGRGTQCDRERGSEGEGALYHADLSPSHTSQTLLYFKISFYLGVCLPRETAQAITRGRHELSEDKEPRKREENQTERIKPAGRSKRTISCEGGGGGVREEGREGGNN